MELKLSIKQILLDILCIKDQITEHFQGNNKYQALLQFLNEKDYYNDDNLSIPALKEIEVQTGLNTYQLRKQLKEMYQNFFDTYPSPPLKFKETEVCFNLVYFKRYANFKCSKMQHIPRIGEHVNVSFLGAKLGFNYFYVKDIRYDFSGTTHFKDIDLKGGFYNKYYQFRFDEAVAKGEIGLRIGSKYYDYEIEEMLGLKRF